MDKLIISGEGFPGTSELLEFLQESAHKPIEVLADAFGENSIIKGMEQQGNQSITSGWFTYQSDIIPFEASAASVGENPVIEIYQQVIEAGYDTDGTGEFINNQPIWRFIRARVGDGNGENVIATLNYNELERVPTNKDLKNANSILKKGGLLINFDESTAVTSGDFNSSSSIATSQQENRMFQVNFDELEDDNYTVIVICNHDSDPFLQTLHSIHTKTNSSFIINFRALSDFSNVVCPFEVIILR